MNKLRKKNLFVDISDDDFSVAVGEYDDELNFNILEKEKLSPSGFNKGKIVNFESALNNLKKIINKIEKKTNFLFSDVNLILSTSEIDCINVSGFKKLNGNQILPEDISYILNDVKTKIVETEKNKSIIHLFNSIYLLDNKLIKNLPIGLHGNFYSHQLSFFMIDANEFKNIKVLFNKCNLNISKVALKSFIDGIKIVNKFKKNTFIKIKVDKNEAQLIFFYESAFIFYQKFNFGSDIILKDISKVCSLDISNVKNIISDIYLESTEKNIFLDKKYFQENNFRKISLNNIKEISSARIEEMVDILFNQNKNLTYLKDKDIPVFLDFEDKNTFFKFKNIFVNHFKECELNSNFSIEENSNTSIKILGELLSKGWAKEAIPVINKKRSWISRIFSGLFE